MARARSELGHTDGLVDQQYMVLGDEVPIKLKFKDVIFVMEDVDAASKVVHRRDGKVTSAVTHTTQIDAPPPKCTFNLLLESTNGTCKELVKLLIAASPRLKQAVR